MNINIPPSGVGRTNSGPTNEPSKKEEKPNPARAEYEKALASLKEGKSDSFILKSKNFRILAGEEKESEGNFFSKLWAKVSSLWSKDSTKEPEDDLGYQIEVTAEELRSLAKNTDSLVEELEAKQREAESKKIADDVGAFLARQNAEIDVKQAAPMPRTEEERGMDAAKNLGEQIVKYAQPALEKARALANPHEKENLKKAEVEVYNALETLEIVPNDDNTTKLMDAMSRLSKATDSVMTRAGNEKKEILANFRTELEDLKKQIPREEVKYTVAKEASGQWRVYTEARNQLTEALRNAENEAVYYENGQIAAFDGEKHLDDIRSISEKLKDAVANYKK